MEQTEEQASYIFQVLFMYLFFIYIFIYLFIYFTYNEFFLRLIFLEEWICIELYTSYAVFLLLNSDQISQMGFIARHSTSEVVPLFFPVDQAEIMAWVIIKYTHSLGMWIEFWSKLVSKELPLWEARWPP